MQPDYNRPQAYALLIVELIFISIMLYLLIYWHFKHPNSLEVSKEYER